MLSAELAKSDPGPDRVVVARAWYHQACRHQELLEAQGHVDTQLRLAIGVALWAHDDAGNVFRVQAMTPYLALVEIARILRDRKRQARERAADPDACTRAVA